MPRHTLPFQAIVSSWITYVRQIRIIREPALRCWTFALLQPSSEVSAVSTVLASTKIVGLAIDSVLRLMVYYFTYSVERVSPPSISLRGARAVRREVATRLPKPGYPSGQRGLTVNQLRNASEVRILHPAVLRDEG